MGRLKTTGALGAWALAMAALALAGPLAAKDESGEERLAKLLEGRIAGEPQACIREFPSASMQVIDGSAIVYGSGRTIYVQRTKRPEDIDEDEILVIRRLGDTRLCKHDMVTTIDRYGGFYTGNLFFDDFIPYTRAKEGDRAAATGSGKADAGPTTSGAAPAGQ